MTIASSFRELLSKFSLLLIANANMIKFLLYCLTFFVFATLKADISIDNPRNLYFVGETLDINLNDNGFYDFYISNDKMLKWEKIERTTPNDSKFNLEIPYVSDKILYIKSILEIPKISEPLWINKKAHSTELRSVVFSADSKLLLTASESEAKIWNLESRIINKIIYLSKFGRVRHISLLNKDTLFISTVNSLIMYDLIGDVSISISEGVSSGNVRKSKFRNNRSQIAFGSDKGFVGIYDYAAMNYVRKFKVSDDDLNNEVYSLAFSPNGDSLVCGTYNGYVYLIDLLNDSIKEIGRHGENNQNTVVFDLSFSSNGKYVVSTGADRSVRVWDLANSIGRVIPNVHSAHIRSCDLTYDGKTIISASLDSLLKFIDFETGFAYSTYKFESQFLYSEISPNNNLLAASARDGSFLLWDLSPATTKDTIMSINCGYKFNLKFDDFSAAYGQEKNIGIKVSHNYDVLKMPAKNYSIDIFAKYPYKKIYVDNESKAGELNFQADGTVFSGISSEIKFTALIGNDESSELIIDSIQCKDPDYYYFFGETSYISTYSNCINNPKPIIIDNYPKINAFYDNKTLHLDVYSVENGDNILQIFDIGGKLVYSEKNVKLQNGWNSLTKIIDVSAGLYFINITTASGNVILTKCFFN